MADVHALHRSNRLRKFKQGPPLGYGSRRNGNRVVSAIWPLGGDRFAGYVEQDGALVSRETLVGVGAAVEFLERDG